MLSRRSQILFLFVITGQVMHSIEEYVTRLYEFFPPARFVSGLVSDDLETGFVILNCSLITVGLGCYLALVRKGGRAGLVAAWAWTALELANGLAHLTIALSIGAYFSGSITAPYLVATAACLAFSLSADNRRRVSVT